MSSKDLRVTLSGVTLDNPVIPASGTYGFGQEFTPYYDITQRRALRNARTGC